MQRLLIIDDEPSVHEVVSAAIGEPQLEIVSVMTIEQARCAARKMDQLDVALVDKNLPDGSGLDFMAELRTMHPDCESILITGYASLESAVMAVEAGAFDYVAKPFDLGALELRIQNGLEKVRLKRAASEVEERNRLLFEHSADAIIIIDWTDGSIHDANPAALELYGYDRTGLLHSQVRTLVTGPSVLDGDAGDGAHVEWHRRVDGTGFPAEVWLRPITVRGRELFIMSVRDVSKREELQGQLLQSQKMNAIGRLAGGIAHDFNNLLVIILGYADMLSRHLDPTDPYKEYATEVLNAAERAAALTRQLLSFSRKKPAQLQTMMLNDAVREVESLLRRTLGEEIELVTELATAQWAVDGDKDHLTQVLLNLAVNARDAMPTGGSLTIHTGNTDNEAELGRAGLEPGRYVYVAVDDTGCGMSDEVAAQVFEPFFTTKRPGAGTGLGLSVVYGLVEQAKGKIRVTSEVGTGSRFTVYLPATNTVPAKRHIRSEHAAASEVRETVLLVEDEGPVRKLVRHILASAGYAVLEAGRGDEALELASSNHFDLLVTDVRMPGMSGRVLADRLEEDRPELPILFISGYPGGGEDLESRENGRVSFLKKPFTEEVLLGKLRRVLEGDVPSA